MSSDLVVKSNRLNMAIQSLSLPELRIIQLAIVDARETGKGLNTDTPLRIDAMRYADAFDTTRQNAYIRMKETEETLFNRRFSFVDSEGKLVKSRWIQRVRYLDNEGAIEIIFTYDVVKCITRLDGAEEFFTQYLLSQTAKLNSVYSVRLYELLVQWKSVGKTPVFDLDMFRGQLGVNKDEYIRISNFKIRVLDSAVKEINDKTDLTVSYTQQKKGRIVSGFSFDVKVKKKKDTKLTDSEKKIVDGHKLTNLGLFRDVDTLDLFHNLTDKQIQVFSYKLAKMPELSSHAPIGADYEQFAQIIANDLKDEKKQAKYKPYLKKLGFKYQSTKGDKSE